jgi:hypothetical protein
MGFAIMMDLIQHPCLAQILVCRTCKQPIDGEEVKQTALQQRLFGSKGLGVCLTCFQEVGDNHDRGYCIRAGKVLRLKRCEELMRKNQES